MKCKLSSCFLHSYFSEPVSGLDAYNVTHVACGSTHSVALNQWGQVFSWGSDTYGQLGHQLGQSIQPVPKIIRALAMHHVVQVACGQRHTIVLTNSNRVFSKENVFLLKFAKAEFCAETNLKFSIVSQT